VPVYAQLGRIGKVAAELQKEGAEIAIHAVDVELIHHCRRADQPWISPTRFLVPATLPEHSRLLLRFPDEHYAFGFSELLPIPGGDVVFALAFAELYNRHLLSPGNVLQRFHER